MRYSADSLRVAADLSLHLPVAKRATIQCQSGDASRRLLVRILVVAHVILDDGQDVVLAWDNRAVGEGEGGVDVIATIEYRADELIVDEDGCGKRFGLDET